MKEAGADDGESEVEVEVGIIVVVVEEITERSVDDEEGEDVHSQ
jgi:hypothetical protein